MLYRESVVYPRVQEQYFCNTSEVFNLVLPTQRGKCAEVNCGHLEADGERFRYIKISSALICLGERCIKLLALAPPPRSPQSRLLRLSTTGTWGLMMPAFSVATFGEGIAEILGDGLSSHW